MSGVFLDFYVGCQKLCGAVASARRFWEGNNVFDNDVWLQQVREDIVDPGREIVDPHHHLWEIATLPYNLEQLLADTASGHNVVQTVFMECSASYFEDGPDHLRPVGETQFVAAAAERAASIDGAAQIAGIIGHADLRHKNLDDVLDAHLDAANGLFRGIRHAGAWDNDLDALLIKPDGPEGLYLDPAFQAGVARLGERGMTYDTWHYHHQNQDFRTLALAVPETKLVLDHFGTPLGVGRFAGKRDEIFLQWKDDVAAIAECPNVCAKLGGLAMPDNGFGWMGRALPPTSDEIVATHAAYYTHMIDCFGPDRCMFESNFPVDRLSVSYTVLWNALKKIAAGYDERSQQLMFSETARTVYQL